jgi:hypothetical protein
MFIDQVFVDHLLCCCRKDSIKQPAVHPIMQQLQRSKSLLAQLDIIDYLLYDAYSNHVTSSKKLQGWQGSIVTIVIYNV